MGKLLQITGKKFNQLTVINYAGTVNRISKWQCRCDCGAIKIIDGPKLISGNTKSCGCLKVKAGDRLRTHSESKNPSKEYIAWQHMKRRCYTKTNKDYKDYGGRGIKVCERWNVSYESFLKDMGRAPSQIHTLDRKDVNGNYCPENCKWATRLEQANNTRVTRFLEHDGIRLSLSQWSRKLGICRASLSERISSGWPLEKALTVTKLSVVLLLFCLMSCSPQSKIRRAERLIKSAEASGAQWSVDTIKTTITVTVPKIEFDTV